MDENQNQNNNDHHAMTANPQCTGYAAEALAEFREYHANLIREGLSRHKPDMKALAALNSKIHTATRRHAKVRKLGDFNRVNTLKAELAQFNPDDDNATTMQRVRDIFTQLDDCHMTTRVLQDTHIGLACRPWKKHVTVGPTVKQLIHKWKIMFQQQQGDLRYQYEVVSHGLDKGIPIGVKLQGKGEAAILGIHTQITKGIDGIKDEPCYAVNLAGEYKDEEDYALSDGTIVYIGMGGRNDKGVQVEDQTENHANRSLMLSCDRQVPVRVMRSHRVDGNRLEVVYEGIYMCTDWVKEPSKDGPLVYKFTLQPLETKEHGNFAVGYEGGSGRGSGSKRSINAVNGAVHNRLEQKINKKGKTKVSSLGG